MRPEREMEIRAACERTGFDRLDLGDSPGEMMRDLLAEIDRLRSSTGGLLLVHRHEIARAVGLPEDAPGHEVVAAVRGAIARAEQAEAQLAALREAVRDVLAEAAVIGGRERSVLICAIGADATAEAYTRRVRAEAMRWEADRWSDQDDDVPRRLRARADEIEGGR